MRKIIGQWWANKITYVAQPDEVLGVVVVVLAKCIHNCTQ